MVTDAQQKELDSTIQKAAEMLRKAYGREVVIRYNSDLRSGGAWLKDSDARYTGNDQVGLSARIIAKVPAGMTRSEWHKKIAAKVGYGDAFIAELHKQPETVVVQTYISSDAVRNKQIINAGKGLASGEYSSVEHSSLSDGLKFLRHNVDEKKLHGGFATGDAVAVDSSQTVTELEASSAASDLARYGVQVRRKKSHTQHKSKSSRKSSSSSSTSVRGVR